MPPSITSRCKDIQTIFLKNVRPLNRRYAVSIFGVFLLLILVGVEFSSFVPQVDAHAHTSPTVDTTCKDVGFSSDGNPFPLCPGPFPGGGNCVWWAWEQWHLLGYDLPLNWGNAADWIVDAQRTGLPMGITPRVGAIAVFPRADGVWAYGTPGHVAFVTSVSDDGLTFNVTYQNYGDPTPVYVGTGYNTSTINQARFQNGQMRFIYFPKMIDPQRFQQLPGVGADAPHLVLSANKILTSSASTLTGNRITLGSQANSSDQEFNADFTGSGYSDLLLYNRQQGRLSLLKLSHGQAPYVSRATDKQAVNSNDATVTQIVSLKDGTTAVDKWGSSLDVHIGDFDGSGHSQILLYDRQAGTIQILSLTPQLTIKKHVILKDWGPDWELYVGRFDGKRSGLFMYKRYAQPDLSATPTDTSDGPQPVTTDIPTSTPNNSSPTVQPSPTSKPKPSPTVKPSPTAKPKPSPTATPKASPTVTPTVTPSPTATPKTTPTVTPSPTPKPSPTVTPTVTPSPTVTPTATPKASPTVTPTVKPSPTATPKATPTITPTAKPSPTVTPTPKPKKPKPPIKPIATPVTQSLDADLVYASTMPSPTPTAHGRELSGSAPEDWEKAGRTANVLVLDFNKDFSVHVQQQYTLWHANWEVYVGRFVNAQQDGIFLYDRLVGEGRIMDFDGNLLINHYQESHNLDGNWVLYSGDFMGIGRSQLFMYDPSSGDGQMLAFTHDLMLEKQVTYSNLGTNLIPYVGHFGMSNMSTMLYDPQSGHSTFISFDKTLAIAQQTTVQSWGQQWQILVGAFLDRQRCLSSGNCSTGDDILVLNRKTGQIEQYVFSFGRKFQVYDNRSQAFARQGIVTSDTHLNHVDTTTFSLLTTLITNIRDEELY